MKKDWLLIGTILATALLIWVAFSILSPEAEAVVITADSGEVLRCSISEDRVLDLPHHTVTIENKSVRVTHSDCTGQDCVRTPPVSRGGQAIVCLPYRLSVRIVSGNAPDSVTY